MAGFTDYLENKLLDHVFGGGDYARPATLYAAAHLASTLNANAASGQNQIVTVHDVPVGAAIVIDPLNLAEAKTVSSKSGSGPYTLTLNSNLSNAYNSGTYVKYDPGDPASLVREPSGNNYSRTSITNNSTNFPAASSGQKQNGTTITFATPSGAWGLVTHLVFYDASSSGNALGTGALSTPKLVQTSDVLSFSANQVTITLD